MLRSVFLAVVASLSTDCLLAQYLKQGSLWYFGYGAGVDFKTDPPTLLSGGQVNNFFRRSCTMSDANGNLVFYTDGMKVWNKHHQQMPNGDNLTLGLNFHSTPSIIVPHPGDPQLYYIFVANSWNGSAESGLHYAIVDISGDNGNGSVIQKNTDLLNPSTILLSGVSHADDQSYWIMGHEWRTRRFFAYRISEMGISTPVITEIGDIYSFWSSDLDPEQMCFSPDGTKLAVAAGGKIQLFDFNSLNGQLSNLRTIERTYESFQGVAFSPSSLVLYGSGADDSMYQMDISKPEQQSIQHSLLKIGTVPRNILTDLQLAYNGKIYGGRGGGDCCQPLVVINNPNVLGMGCDFRGDGLVIPNDAVYGLPLALQSYYRDPTTIHTLPACTNVPADIFVTSLGYSDSLLWDYGDGIKALVKNPVVTGTNHRYDQAGTFTITLTKYIGNISRTITGTIDVRPGAVADLGNDITICEGESLTLSVGEAPVFTWSTNDISREITVSESGTFWLMVNNHGCIDQDTVVVRMISDPQLALADYIVECNSDEVSLVIPLADKYTYQWSSGETSNEIQVRETGMYSVSVSNETCSWHDSTYVQFAAIKEIGVEPKSYTVTHADEVVVWNVKANNADVYTWKFGDGRELETSEMSAGYRYPAAGTYLGTVTAQNTWGCSAEGQFSVTVPMYEIIPNIFTPNADGINDTFVIIYNGDTSNFRLNVFNRTGQVVFQTNDPSIQWRAENAAAAVYYFEVVLGKNRRKGWVQVMR